MTGSAWAREQEPPAVGVLLPSALIPTVLPLLERLQGPADVRIISWADPVEVRRAKAEGDRSPRWIRAHEQPLDDRQREELSGAEVLLAMDVPLDIAALAPKLRFVQAMGAGVEQVVAVLRGSGVRLCSSAGLSGDKIAEFVMARVLGVWVDLRRLDELQRARRWGSDQVEASSFAGRTIAVIGTGGIGQAIARRAAAFDLRMLGVRRRTGLPAPAGFERVVGSDGLEGVVREADVVVVCAPATARTRRLIGEAELAAMRPGAILCNVARGSLVDEGAVAQALESGRLGAAILDVFEREPLSRRSPLWTSPRAYLSPHVANAWRPEYVGDVMDLLVENIERDRQGRPLRNQVDLDEGY